MSKGASLIKRVLAIAVWPFLFIGGNLFLWVTWPAFMLFSERMKQDIAAGTVAEVVSPLSTKVLTHWLAPYTDGLRCQFPQGFILRATEDIPRGSRSGTFVPTDIQAFNRDFLPAEVASHEKFAGVSIPLTGRKIGRHLRFLGSGHGPAA